MNPAIRVENLAKRYRVGTGQREDYRTLREALTSGPRAVMKGLRALTASRVAKAASAECFWALKDVSFEVQPGEVVGIIGLNGAGKSTLLKILSRIVEPTGGRVEMRGRIGSLLEVGTGFHPELTGRENVFLNGAILGMSRQEIHRKFNEIAAFAEIGQFLDTPVKHYSSGMYIRLAFAVAAHLDLEILVIDEVLAVGDASYQRRCLERMNLLATSGTTILFVSHSMEMIPRLCRRAVLLERGQVLHDGPARAVVDEYLKMLSRDGNDGDLRHAHRTGDGRARFTRVQLVDHVGQPLLNPRSGDDLRLQVQIEAGQDIAHVELAVCLESMHGTRLISSWTREANYPIDLQKGHHTFLCRFSNVRLRPGHSVVVVLWMSTQHVIDNVNRALILTIEPDENTLHLSADKAQGIFVPECDWVRIPVANAPHSF